MVALRRSQILIVWSWLEDAIHVPLGLTATSQTEERWPFRVSSSAPLRVDQILAISWKLLLPATVVLLMAAAFVVARTGGAGAA